MNKNIERGFLSKITPLNAVFYERKNVVRVAKDLLGKILITNFENIITAARIAETEAYNGIYDKASHAYNGKRTARTEIMYRNGGVAYVYLCYGIHHLFNVVTNAGDIPHAVLIRAAEPLEGVEEMLRRTGKEKLDNTLASGPGNVCRAMGIHTKHSGFSLLGDKIFIGDDGFKLHKKNIAVSQRIGVDYAAEDALLPYRFFLRDSPFVSGRKNK